MVYKYYFFKFHHNYKSNIMIYAIILLIIIPASVLIIYIYNKYNPALNKFKKQIMSINIHHFVIIRALKRKNYLTNIKKRMGLAIPSNFPKRRTLNNKIEQNPLTMGDISVSQKEKNEKKKGRKYPDGFHWGAYWLILVTFLLN